VHFRIAKVKRKLTALPMHKIVALGDKAVLAEFAQSVDLAVNMRIQRLAKAIGLRRVPWVRDVVPGIGSLAIHFDRQKLAPGEAAVGLATALIEDCLAGDLPDLDALTRTIELPVCYEEDFAPDLAEVAERCKLTPAEVVEKHAAASHRVLMVGFVPGHPYIGGLDRAIAVPRRPTPRTRVATGSIAIANTQTVVYPFPTPSGWSIIGRTPEQIFDVRRQPPAMMEPGDRVSFVPIGIVEYERRLRSRNG
jgi:inhibitor of KinA